MISRQIFIKISYQVQNRSLKHLSHHAILRSALYLIDITTLLVCWFLPISCKPRPRKTFLKLPEVLHLWFVPFDFAFPAMCEMGQFCSERQRIKKESVTWHDKNWLSVAVAFSCSGPWIHRGILCDIVYLCFSNRVGVKFYLFHVSMRPSTTIPTIILNILTQTNPSHSEKNITSVHGLIDIVYTKM